MPDQALVRSARLVEMAQVYAMGFDTWADGATFEDYLRECASSKKYAGGHWRVLEHPVYGLISSLLIHRFAETGFAGLGSIATRPDRRLQGAATRLIATVLSELDESGAQKPIFLYSDIDAGFYRRFGFEPLPAERQRYKTTTCMVRCMDPQFQIQRLSMDLIPSYF